MFDDIVEMEREIDIFRKNMVASSELVEGISELTAETKKQKESFSASTEALLKRLNECVAQFKNDHESALRTLNADNNATIAALQEGLSSEQHSRISELERIQAELQKCLTDAAAQADAQVRTLSQTSDAMTSAFHEDVERVQNLSLSQVEQLNADSKRIISEMKSVIEAQQSTFNEKVAETEAAIQGYQTQAQAKYKEFVNRLESTNVDRIFKEVQDLKRSIQTKFVILVSGMGITLLAALLGLFLK